MSDEMKPQPTSLNEAAIRLWLIDEALKHLTRHQGVLGLGAHTVDQSLRAERDELIGRIKAASARFAA